MKRFLIWISPVVGVIIGMAGILIFRNQSSAEAQFVEPAQQVQADSQRPADRGQKLDLEAFTWTTMEQVRPSHDRPSTELAPQIGAGTPAVDRTTESEMIVVPDVESLQ